MDISIKSHIQIPKMLLKGFSFDENIINENGKPQHYSFVWRINKSLQVEKVNIQSENTEFCFYDDEIETFLKRIEDSFGNLKTRIRLLSKGASINLSSEDILITRTMCMLACLRSQSIQQSVAEKSVFVDGTNMPIQNLLIALGIEHSDEIFSWIISSNISFIKNNTTKNLILPKWYATAIQNGGWQEFVIPIDPKLAILLSERKFYDNGNLFVAQIDTDKDLQRLNKEFITKEYNNNEGVLYAKEKDDLVQYIDFLKQLRL